MITFLLAAAAAAQSPIATDADLRCMADYLVVAGNVGQDASATPEDKAGVQSIVMYFFGQVDARHPGADIESEINKIVSAPTFPTAFKTDVERCNAEAVARGKYLESFGGGDKPAAGAAPTPAPAKH
jgi:catalase (peroxidase I)